jgi:hypothetical protein
VTLTKDDSDQLRRALNNLIKLGLCSDYTPVVVLAEALIILNLNSILPVDTLLCFLQKVQASINGKIREELLSYF